MITDADLAALIAGTMSDSERAEFAERVREYVAIVHDFAGMRPPIASQGNYSECQFCRGFGDAPGHEHACIWRRSREAECPSHGPDTRQRDGRCMRCGAKL